MAPMTPEVALAHALDPHASPFGCLGLPDARYKLAEIRQAYRTAALLLHPDKCELPDATRAFQRISQAFDTLSQPGAADKILGLARKSCNNEFSEQHDGCRKKDHVFDCEFGVHEKSDEDKQKWWDAGWSEFQDRLRRQEMEARQVEAVDEAMRCGEDPLDAYMALIQEEVACAASHSKDHAKTRSAKPEVSTPVSRFDDDGPFTAKRCHVNTSVESEDSAALRRTHKRCMPQTDADAVIKHTASMRLVTGKILSVNVLASCTSHVKGATSTALDHLESDGSELSE